MREMCFCVFVITSDFTYEISFKNNDGTHHVKVFIMCKKNIYIFLKYESIFLQR